MDLRGLEPTWNQRGGVSAIYTKAPGAGLVPACIAAETLNPRTLMDRGAWNRKPVDMYEGPSRSLSQPLDVLMPDHRSPQEIEDFAAQLTPAQLLLLPFYHHLKNELTNPDRIRVQTEYFWRRWAPHLGPTLTCLVITLRGYCYYNKLTQEKRDWCFPEQQTLAAEIGVSVDTIQRELKRPEAAYFIRRQPQYRYNPTNRTTRRIADRYHIAMDDPIAPDDEGKLAVAAAERILQKAPENQVLLYRPQNAAYTSRPVDNRPYEPQTAAHTATANCQRRTSTSKRDFNNVNVNTTVS